MADNRSKTFITKAWLLKQATAVLASVTGNRLPPFSAIAAIIEQDEQLLLLQRSDGMGYSLPGGIMRWNESTQEAVQREVKEETGYNVEVVRLFNNYSGPERDTRFSSVCMAYEARVLNGRLTPSSEGTPTWVPISDVMNLNLAFDVRQVISDYIARQ